MNAPFRDLDALVEALTRVGALVELVALAVCLGLSWAVVRALKARSQRPRAGVWYGERIFDGVLFPALALGLALVARWLLGRTQVIAVLQLAVPILATLLVIRVAVRVLRVAFPTSRLVRTVERTFSWVVWLALVLWVTGLAPLVLQEMESIHWKVGGADVSLRSLLEGALSAVVVLVAALWISSAIESRLLADSAGNLSVRKIAANAVRALLLLVGLLLAMSAAGIPLGALSVIGGAVGVGIGLGLQKLASNYVSGFVILAEQSLRIGDMVRVDNFEGRITDITTRYTKVRALNGRQSLVPNEMLITQRVENLTQADPKVGVSSDLLLPFGTDLAALAPQIVSAVSEVPRVLADPAPALLLSGFTSDGLAVQVSFTIADADKGTANVKSDVNHAVLRVLDAQGIRIPYPNRAVHAVAPPAAG